MSDKTVSLSSSDAPEKLRDMGDSTFAKVVAIGGAALPSVTITRPNDTTAYTAGDVVGAASAILEFQNAGPAGAVLLITEAQLAINVSALPSGMTTFRLHLYNAAPTAIADNAAWDLVAGDRAAYLGYIDIEQMVDVGSTLFVQSDKTTNASLPKQVKLAAGVTSLYGLLVTHGGYTPTAQAVKKLTLATMAP